MGNLKWLLFSGVFTAAMLTMPLCYAQNDRVSRNESMQKKEIPNSNNSSRENRNSSGTLARPNRPSNDEKTANRPGFTAPRPEKDNENNNNNNNNNGGYVGRPGHRPGDNGGVDRPSSGHRPGGAYVAPPAHRPSGGGYNHGGYVAPPSYHGHNGYYNNDRQYRGGYYVAPPVRPYRPDYRPVPRPVPPPYYRPYASARYIDNILGLTFGISYIASLDYLYDNGYNVDGYNDGVVYLRNVNEMSYNWPDATLNYNSIGLLENMQFVYSTSYRNTSRYDRLYRDLCRYYGAPVTYSRTANGYTGVWYGAGQRNYVSLEFDMSYVNGSIRYYTILSYGY